MSTDAEWGWMRRAVDLAKQSIPEPGRRGAPNVGVVIVKDGELIAEGYRGCTGIGEHAEYGALKGVAPEKLCGATAYTTLEPCTKRTAGKIPCAERLLAAGVREVHVGMYDPNPHIFRAGWRVLRDGGILLRDFTPELRAELRAFNAEFLDQYRYALGIAGTERFDYEQRREFTLGLEPSVKTRWSHAGKGVIHALAESGHIALARGARSIREVDDPGALDFDATKYTVRVEEGEVVVFSNGKGAYALVRIVSIQSAQRGDPCYMLDFEYELRVPKG